MSAIEETQDRPVEADDADDPLFGAFQDMKRQITDAQRVRGKWYEEAKECFDFEANHQWSEEDLQILKEQNRPAVVFNRVSPLIGAVCGLEINNRQGVVFLPREQGDVGVNELLTSTAKWVRDECNAEDEESEAFKDMSICGEGWTETRMDNDEDPMGKIVEERIFPLEMGVNKGASRANYSDARIIYRAREMEADDVRALLGLDDELTAEAMNASKWFEKASRPADGGQGNKKDYPEETPARVRAAGTRRNTITVIQCQYWKREQINLVATPDDEKPVEMNNEDFEKFQNRAAQSMLTENPIQYDSTKATKKIYYECFLGSRMLDAPRKLDTGFTFKAMTGYRDNKEKCFFGMMRLMMDPQRWANKFFSQTMNIMNTNAKGGIMAETDAFVNKRDATRDWSDPTKIIWTKPGSLQKQKIKDRTAPPMPPQLADMMMFAISSIRDVTGINLELLGQADREQAASLEAQRRQSAMTVLAVMFNNLRRFRKNQGRLLLHFIFMLPPGTLVRVTEQGQQKYIPLILQDSDSVEKYDVIVDEAPVSPDQKQYIWGITSQILQMGILPPPAIIELLKYSPYPESVVQEIKNALGMGSEMPPEMLKQRLDQAEQALQVLEQQLKEAMANAKSEEDKNALELMSREIEEYEAETDRLKAQWDARIKAAQVVMQRAEGEHDSGGSESDQPQRSQQSSGVGLSPTVVTGSQSLPEIGLDDSEGGAAPIGGGSALEQKVDALADMVQQLVSALQPQQAPVQPDMGPAEEPPAGEM